MIVPGLFPVALPPGIDVAGGWQESPPFETKAALNSWQHKIDGAFVEVPTSVIFNAVTDATAGNRTIFVICNDANGHEVYQIPAPVVQPPGVTFVYVALFQLSAQSSSSSGSQLLALPQMALLPGWSLGIFIQSPGPADTFAGVNLNVIRFSTERAGGPRAAVAAQPGPTPVLL